MYIDNFKCVGKLNAKQIRDVNKYTRSKYGWAADTAILGNVSELS
jgi:hypothetical protein